VTSAEIRSFRREAAVVLAAGEYAAIFVPHLGMLGASLTWRGDELLSLHGGLAAYRRRSSTGIPLLAPWANRLATDRFYVAGTHVDLTDLPVKRDPNGLPIHGTMTARPGWTITRLEPGRLVAHFSYDAPELLAAFPFPHQLELDVRLAETGLGVCTTVRPTGRKPVPISFGWHPYFQARGPRRRWLLRAPARDHLELDTRGLPTGRSSREEAGALALGDRAFDDLYGLGRDRRFVLGGGGRAVEVGLDAGYSFAQLFAPPGKRFVAIEPMTAPTNALVTGMCTVIPPGESYRAEFRVSATSTTAPAL
jgi:galactose mutarotase-like enzyme